MERRVGDYVVSDEAGRIDPEAVRSFLAKSYWAERRSAEAIRKSLGASLCFGVYLEGTQVGFARAVTDGAVMYWLCDVWIEEGHRGKGLGVALVETVVSHPALAPLVGILATRDAHGLYARFGFERDGERFMRRKPASA